MINPWAIFDVDGTLIPGTSMERLFFCELWHQKLVSSRTLLTSVFTSRKNGMSSSRARENWRGSKWYLASVPFNEINYLATNFVREHILGKISIPARAELEKQTTRGYQILFMSGSLDVLVQPLASLLGATASIGTGLEVVDGLLTGRINGIHPYGKGKRKLLLERADMLGIDLNQSTAFANHYSDRHHLAEVRVPYAINPSQKLARYARRKNWEIRYWI